MPLKLARIIRRSKELCMRRGSKNRVVTLQIHRSFIHFLICFLSISSQDIMTWPAKEKHSSPRGVSQFITYIFCHKKHSMLCKTINRSSCPVRLTPEVTSEWVQVYNTVYAFIYMSAYVVPFSQHTIQSSNIYLLLDLNQWISLDLNAVIYKQAKTRVFLQEKKK